MKYSESGALELLSTLDENHMPLYGFLCANANFIYDKWMVVVYGHTGWWLVDAFMANDAGFIKLIGGLKDVYQD